MTVGQNIFDINRPLAIGDTLIYDLDDKGKAIHIDKLNELKKYFNLNKSINLVVNVYNDIEYVQSKSFKVADSLSRQFSSYNNITFIGNRHNTKFNKPYLPDNSYLIIIATHKLCQEQSSMTTHKLYQNLEKLDSLAIDFNVGDSIISNVPAFIGHRIVAGKDNVELNNLRLFVKENATLFFTIYIHLELSKYISIDNNEKIQLIISESLAKQMRIIFAGLDNVVVVAKGSTQPIFEDSSDLKNRRLEIIVKNKICE
jgi:hypothetical protein